MSGMEPVEMDPTGRYSRSNKLLGKGAYKLVYKGFDNTDAIEVAWNKLQTDRLSMSEIEKVSREVDFLKVVNHKNIILFFDRWQSIGPNGKPQMDFITELMTSGTLKEFIKNARHIKLKVIRRWSRNILEAIDYLHSKNPPIMHRDLKCDNIFINGHVGEVKIGDLGLSSVKEKDKAITVIGTPQFMAPELYEESYTEKIDVYAFGMCMLEMLTMEYPYGECENPAQIFRKVYQGEKPASLLKLVDSEFKQVILRCLSREDERPSASELLNHPLFVDWNTDDGRLSNVDLVRTDQSMRVGNAPTLANVETADMYVHHSPKLDRDVVIIPGAQDNPPQEAVPTEKGSIKIGLNVPVNGSLKNIAFMFDPDVDSPQEIANEMLLEFGLDEAQVEQIRQDIEDQVRAAASTAAATVVTEQQPMNSALDFFIERKAEGEGPELLTKNPTAGNGQMDSPQVGSSLPADGQVEATPAGSTTASLGTSTSHRSRYGSRVNMSPGTEAEHVHNSKVFNLCMLLMNDCANGRFEEARTKINKGASPVFSDYDKRTPLHLAASEGHGQIVDLLLKHGASPYEKDRWGSTPMADAVKNNHESVIRVLEDFGVPREDTDIMSGEFASMELLEFCARGLQDLVRERLVAGVSAQFADYDKRTPLHLAASEGHADVAELLLVNGASMDVKDRFGRTPIDDAIKNGNKAVLRVMKQYGGSVPSKLLDSGSSLDRLRGLDFIDHAANGRLFEIQEALKEGANVDYADFDGRTALHLAAKEGQLQVVEFLLEKGVKVNCRDRWGVSPADEAVQKGHIDILAVLERAGGLRGADLGRPLSPPHSSHSGSGSQDEGHFHTQNILNIESIHAMSLKGSKASELAGVEKYV